MNRAVAGAIIDNYELVRIIGQGGFGTVWLAKSKLLNSDVALKILAQRHGEGSQRELNAVQAYKRMAVGGLGVGLMPIDHVGLFGDRVFYVMPIADGVETGSPTQADWKPLTLSARIARHTEKGTWFTSQEIQDMFGDICKAAQVLSDAGLVHRDIKPDNILFFHGRAVISDVSLVTDDADPGTRYGTPGFSSPSWYLESGGKIDMFSIAATLFTVLTGQAPDKMGRAAFQWPPGGKGLLSEPEQREWTRLHRVVLRATNEDAAERFITFAELGKAIRKSVRQTGAVNQTKRGRRWLIMGLSVAALIAIVLFQWRARPQLSPDEVLAEMIRVHHDGDLTAAHRYETRVGRVVAKWLFTQPWVDLKLSTYKVVDRALLGDRYEIECQVIEDGKSETVRLIFVREAGVWRFHDIYLMELKGVKFYMNLSRFAMHEAGAEEELASKNHDPAELPKVNFIIDSLKLDLK